MLTFTAYIRADKYCLIIFYTFGLVFFGFGPIHLDIRRNPDESLTGCALSQLLKLLKDNRCPGEGFSIWSIQPEIWYAMLRPGE